MNHLEFAELESAALEPHPWDHWIKRARVLAGHDLDGDEASGTDRYSMDSAYDAFEAGWTPDRYVTWFKGSEYVAVPSNAPYGLAKARFLAPEKLAQKVNSSADEWRKDGDNARDAGDTVEAGRCYANAQLWLGMMKVHASIPAHGH